MRTERFFLSILTLFFVFNVHADDAVSSKEIMKHSIHQSGMDNLSYSRYGNYPKYKVAGKTYNVLNSAVGFKEKGTASWYGKQFHKHRTSSGEIYNMYELTAAHRNLPLPTYVKVKNLRNGREIIVRVNDRGPFHKGRIIDLSYAAAKELGFVRKGTAPVEIISLDDKREQANYYVQAAAFSKKNFALLLKNNLSTLMDEPVSIDYNRRYYRVKIGPLKHGKDIERVRHQLGKAGISESLVVMG